MNTIAERIKFAMRAKNKKQVDIVKDTGISKGAFSSYLSGQYNPKADKMELIADSLDVDLRWLYGQNVPMEHTSQNDNSLQYVFYNNSCSEYLLDNLNDIYIAMMTQYAALIPRFYVLVNRAGNAMHILPLFLKEDSSQFYECPSDFFYSDRHTIFTRDFESIHMVLTTATIYYYGIDTKTYEPKVTKLAYSQTDDCFYIDNGIQDAHIKAFEKELEKEREKKEKELEKAKKKAEKEGKEYVEPTVFLPVDVYAPGTMDIYDYISLTFTEPLASVADSTVHLKQKIDSLWRDVPFDFIPDSLNLMRYNVYADWEPGESYTFEVDSTAFQGIYGLFTDKVKKEFKVKKPEEYGQIFFDVSGADSLAFVDLLDAQDKVVRTVPVVNGRADFYFLNPGKYSARLINDRNGNGVWDTGKYEDKRQPEEVYYYYQVLELKANFDLTQSWNIHDRPLDQQKPGELKKQKPDEDKKKKNQNNRNSGNRR